MHATNVDDMVCPENARRPAQLAELVRIRMSTHEHMHWYMQMRTAHTAWLFALFIFSTVRVLTERAT